MLIEVSSLDGGSYIEDKMKTKTLLINTDKIVFMYATPYCSVPAYILQLERATFYITPESAKKILAIANKPL